MYKAELYFRAFTHDGHATLFKELTLPFVSFPGLHVYTSAKDVEGRQGGRSGLDRSRRAIRLPTSGRRLVQG
jgi:hypothetical protein